MTFCFIFILYLFQIYWLLCHSTLEARHSAVLGGHVVPEEVLGEVHRQPLVSPASLVLVSVSVALLVEVAVLRCLETDIDKYQLLKI